MKVYGGIDLGGTTAKIGIIDTCGEFVAPVKRVSTTSVGSPQELLFQMAKVLREMVEISESELVSLGMGTPGIVDLNGNLIGKAVNIAGWDKIDIAGFFKKEFSVPVFLGNDVNMTAFGEWKLGAGKACSSMLCVSLGTGVGSGLILDNQLYLGERGLTGEIGHLVTEYNGRKCSCGNHGCLERYSSANGMVASCHLWAGDFPDSDLARRSLYNEEIDCKGIYQAFYKGDKLAVKIHNNACEMLARGIGAAANLIGFEQVVLCGGVMKEGDTIINEVYRRTESYILPSIYQHFKIVKGITGEYAGLLGAAFYGKENLSEAEL